MNIQVSLESPRVPIPPKSTMSWELLVLSPVFSCGFLTPVAKLPSGRVLDAGAYAMEAPCFGGSSVGGVQFVGTGMDESAASGKEGGTGVLVPVASAGSEVTAGMVATSMAKVAGSIERAASTLFGCHLMADPVCVCVCVDWCHLPRIPLFPGCHLGCYCVHTASLTTTHIVDIPSRPITDHNNDLSPYGHNDRSPSGYIHILKIH